MSLYDKYHSSVNIDYIWNILSQVVYKETNEDIKDNNDYKQIFIENSKNIFKEVNSDELSEINKILLDKSILELTNKIKLKNNTNISTKIDENSTIQDKYNQMIQSRNTPLMKPNDDNDLNVPLNNGNPFSTMIENINNQDINNVEPNIQETIIQPEIGSTNIIENVPIKEEIIYPKIKISSNKRTNIQSSRYNYDINLYKNNIKSSELKFIDKILIPIEDNYIFSSPILHLDIKELNLNFSFELDHVLDKNGREYGYYIPLEKHLIELNQDIEKLSIDIRDISETKYENIDIAKVNIIQINKTDIVFTCTNVNGNFLVNDYIKIINNYTKNFKLNYPLKIKSIVGNSITCDYNSNISKKLTDVDMKLLNTSNQNIIYFN
tara:strand:- start:1050 stop:2189 length:1140 start_codon:yes stop_codon:yes gene_type:complete